MENQPDTCRSCGAYMLGCGYDPLCDNCVEEKAKERLAITTGSLPVVETLNKLPEVTWVRWWLAPRKRIAQLRIDLRKSREFNASLAQENWNLKQQIEDHAKD